MDPRTAEGELLTPQQFPDEVVKKLEAKLGSMGTAGQLQQRPQPREGALFKWPWFEQHRYLDGGDFYNVGGKAWQYNECWHMVIMDPAGGVSDSADYTAIGSFAVTPNNNLLIVNVVRERIPWEDILQRLKGECDAMARQGRRVEFAGCEDAFLQRVLIRLGRRVEGMPPLRALNPNLGEGKSKSPLVRALPAVVRTESGQIWIPEKDWPWVEVLKSEALVFTGSDKQTNDVISALSYAASEVEKGSVNEGVDMAFAYAPQSQQVWPR